MTRIAAFILALLFAIPALAQSAPPSLGYHTVYGCLGVPGQKCGEAIPFANLAPQLIPYLPAFPTVPGVINVPGSFGAVCDGTTDDTTAIQAAVTAAGGANTGSNLVKTTLRISAKCLVNSTITVRNVMAGVVVPFVIECSGGDAGLVWGGTDNTGPLLTFGDATDIVLDSGFLVNHCLLAGKDSSHKPSVAVLFANNQNAKITDSGIVNTYVGVKCTAQCLFAHVDHTYFACTGNCIQPAVDNGAQYAENNFIVCGGWCFFGANEASSLLINNYFEGNVAGASGSVHVAGDGIRLIANTFEDQSTAAGSGFLSIELNNVEGAYLAANYYVGGCGGGAGCPNYFIALDGAASAAEFHGETFGSGTGAIGFAINATASGINAWYGGMNCIASQVWGGTAAGNQALVAACPIPSQGAAYTNANLQPIVSAALATNNSATSGTTLTAFNISGGGAPQIYLAMSGTLGGAANATLPTVAALVAALPPIVAQTQSYRLRVLNESSANFTWTVLTNTGWTLLGTMTIAQNTWRDFIVTFAPPPGSTATLQSVGAGTN